MNQTFTAFLERMRWPESQAKHHGLVYRGPADFLLQHGRWYDLRPRPADVHQGAPRCCYGNAMVLAVQRGWPYVEGYAMCSVLSIPVHHAWNNVEGGAVDNTWKPGGLAYFGVEFCAERADDCAWNGEASVLDDWKRGWPLFKERWTGEPAIQWPPSERIELLRTTDNERFLALRAKIRKEGKVK